MALFPKTAATKPAVVQGDGIVALGLKTPLLTIMTNEPWSFPVTPAATVPPGFVSQPPGLEPAFVTNVPFLNSSMTVKVPFGPGDVSTLKNRSNESSAQLLPHVLESGDVLGKGP